MRRRAWARLDYALSGAGIVDLLAVLPFWFAVVLPADLRVLLVLRLIRFLKLARYSPAMRSLLDALYGERRALSGCLVILLGATLIAASLMHLVEAPRAARQVRHHPRRHVVGDRDARHRRLWRRRADHGVGKLVAA